MWVWIINDIFFTILYFIVSKKVIYMFAFFNAKKLSIIIAFKETFCTLKLILYVMRV